MSQNDYVISNDTAANVRADLNLALAALASQSSGATAPATTYANMIWYDTATDTLKMRSESDDAWITLGTLNQSLNTFGAKVAASTASQISALTGSDAITPAVVATALTSSTPSGASDWTPAWGTFITSEWVVTANRTLNNPTGVVVGTTRAVTIKSSDATARTVSFGSNFKGDLPTVSVTNASFVTLFLYAVSATQILVSDKAWS